MTLATHVFFFTALAVVIVVLGAMYSEPDDARLLRVLPRRIVVFLASCVGVSVVMLVLEALFT